MLKAVDTVVFIVLHNPIPSLGLWLFAASLLFTFEIKTKMVESESEAVHLFPHPADWELTAHYLAVRSQHGWSPWPVYLSWSCQAAGIFTLILGVFS